MSEFARPVRLDMLGTAPHSVAIEASAEERVALATRFGLRRLDRLTAQAALVREGDVVRAAGTVAATVIQACVATDADVAATLAVPFDLRFEPEHAVAEVTEMELDEAALDVVAYRGGAVDLGEAAAQTLALALDPWPRAPEADDVLRAAGVRSEGEEREPSAFAALKGLLKQ